jgi:hypothetical protein
MEDGAKAQNFASRGNPSGRGKFLIYAVAAIEEEACQNGDMTKARRKPSTEGNAFRDFATGTKSPAD